MQVFMMKGGGFLGFYQEIGSTVKIVGTRTVTKRVRVWETITEEVTIEGEWTEERFYIEGHYEQRNFLVLEETVERSKMVRGQFEKNVFMVRGQFEKQEFWLEPYVEIRYRTVHIAEQPAYRDHWEQVDGVWVHFPAKEYKPAYDIQESYEVEIQGCWQDRMVWVPEHEVTEFVWVPEHEETYFEVIPEHQEVREVWVPIRELTRTVQQPDKVITVEQEVWSYQDVEVQDPIFAYADPPDTDNYKIVRHVRGAVWPPSEAWDYLEILHIPTQTTFEMNAEYVGLATQTEENEFVIP